MTPDVLANIPRWLTGVSDWFACILYVFLLPCGMKKPKQLGLLALFGAALCTFLVVTDGFSGLLFNVFISTSALLMLACIAISGQMTLKMAAYCTARAYILAGLAASLAWQLYSFFELRYARWQSPVLRVAFLVGVVGAVHVVLYLLERTYQKEFAGLSLKWSDVTTEVVIAACVYFISSLSYVSLETPFSASSDPEAFNVRTMVYLGGIAVLFAHHMQVIELHTRFENNALQNILHAQYDQYRRSQDSIDLINQKHHDLKHQIAVLRGETDLSRKNAYLDEMEDQIRQYEAQYKTGNEVLDTVLMSKSIYCQTNGIELTCVAEGGAIDFLDIMDICSLFGNALDNAIEGVKKIENPEKRLVHVSVAKQKGFLRIRVENCYEGNLVYEGNLPVTTKRDKQYHGYGLKSIQSIAAKYGGSATIETRDGWFELRILVPIPQ